MDNYDRSTWKREPSPKSFQFSMVANMDFQFWDFEGEAHPNEDMSPISRAKWWYQAEEPEPPPGWSPASDWWDVQPGVRCRMVALDGEERRLSDEQLSVVKL